MTIIILIIIALFIFFIIKPYFIHFHSTLLITGELGGGKTLNAVKSGRIIKRIQFTTKIKNLFIKLFNKIRKHHNKRIKSKYEKDLQNKKRILRKYYNFWQLKPLYEMPRIISNIPIKYKYGRYWIWSTQLTKEMLLLKERIPQNSVVLIDEIPQLVNQFNWNENEVKNNLNEFATFFRHYVNGLLIMTAQADSQVVKQLRDKMSQFYWMTNFRRFLKFFYKCDVCQFMSSDVVANINTGFIEDNTKTVYGVLFHKLYDSRAFSERYNKLPIPKYKVYNKFKTNKIIRFSNYKSPLDD